MPQHDTLARQQPGHRAAPERRAPKQTLTPEELALLRTGRRHEADSAPGAVAAAMARQIGNRAMGAYIARMPSDKDLDALLGAPGAPTAATAPTPPTAAPASAGEQAEAASSAEAAPAEQTGAVEQEANGGAAAPSRNIADAENLGDILSPTGQAPGGGFSPKKSPWPLKPGKVPAQVAEGGAKGPGAVSLPQAEQALTPTATANERESAEAATPQAAGEERAAPAAGEAREQVEGETAGATREAESQGAGQAESAGQAVASEAHAGEAEVETAGEAAQAEQEAAPAAEETGQEPSWLATARGALQRALGFITDHARQATQFLNSLGTRIVGLAQQSVQTLTQMIRGAVATVGSFTASLLGQLQGTIAAVVSRAQAIAREVREAAGRAVNWVFSLMGDIGARIRTGVTEFLRGSYRRLVPLVRNMRAGIERGLASLTNQIVNTVRQRGQQLRELLQRIVAQIIARIRTLRDLVRETIASLIDSERPAVATAVRWLRDHLRRAGGPVLRALSAAFTRATTAGINGVRNALRSIGEPVANAYRTVRNFLRLSVLPVLEGAREYAPEIAQEAEIAAGQGETSVQTVNTSIEAELLSTEAAAQDGATTLAAEINAVPEG